MRKSLKIAVATLAAAALTTVPALASPRVGDRVGSSKEASDRDHGIPTALLVAAGAIVALALVSGSNDDESDSD